MVFPSARKTNVFAQAWVLIQPSVSNEIAWIRLLRTVKTSQPYPRIHRFFCHIHPGWSGVPAYPCATPFQDTAKSDLSGSSMPVVLFFYPLEKPNDGKGFETPVTLFHSSCRDLRSSLPPGTIHSMPCHPDPAYCFLRARIGMNGLKEVFSNCHYCTNCIGENPLNRQ